MKSAILSKGYRGDKELINFYDKKIIEIMSINNSYYINFSTVKLLIHKLSSETKKKSAKSQLRGCQKKKRTSTIQTIT